MLSTIFVSIFLFGFFVVLPALALSCAIENTPNCKTGGKRHEWYRGGYMLCAAHEGRLPGDSVTVGNNGCTNPRGWDYRRERHCLSCDRREYDAGYVVTSKLDKNGKPELETKWLPVPGFEGSITNHGYANYHTPGQRYDAEGFRI